jgi:exonuclease VII small subunit
MDELQQARNDLESARMQFRAAQDALRFGRRFLAQATERVDALLHPTAEEAQGNGSRSSEATERAHI